MANAFLLRPHGFADIGAYDSAPGFPIANAGNDYAGVVWRSRVGDNAHFVIDFGADVPVDTVMLFGVWGDIAYAKGRARLALATAAQGPAFSVEHTADGTGAGRYWLDPGLLPIFAGGVTDPGNGVFLWTPPAGVARPGVARYLYLNFVGLGPGGYIQIARIVAGQAIRLERNFGYGGAHGVRDLGSLDFSARGVLQRRRGKKLRTVGLTFSHVRRDEVEAQTGPLLERIGNTEMVALVTDPAPHPMLQRRCYYGPLVGDLGHTWRNAAAWEAKVNLVSVF